MAWCGRASRRGTTTAASRRVPPATCRNRRGPRRPRRSSGSRWRCRSAGTHLAPPFGHPRPSLSTGPLQ
ncbi:MAG: hypothetical protein F4029_19420 [Gammaproteobacteria bacterium]|nr:hypothetical protein [Gammaproteobacteria bacterium]MYF31476.1 hypothetical protein [Gammaproteobacteria bacterium]MYK48382.1 hypothetical protein [Gammaproteobacteria bacterium]